MQGKRKDIRLQLSKVVNTICLVKLSMRLFIPVRISHTTSHTQPTYREFLNYNKGINLRQIVVADEERASSINHYRSMDEQTDGGGKEKKDDEAKRDVEEAGIGCCS